MLVTGSACHQSKSVVMLALLKLGHQKINKQKTKITDKINHNVEPFSFFPVC